MARPSSFTQEIAAAICERLAEGESLRQICLSDDMPDKATVFRWLGADKQFCDQYARARELQTEAMAEEILEIADDGSHDTSYGPQGQERPDTEWINRSRLRVDARKWLMSKLAPKKYGDKMQLAGDGGGPLEVVFRTVYENAAAND